MSPSGHDDPGNQPRPDGSNPPPRQPPQQRPRPPGPSGPQGPPPQRPASHQPPAQPPSQGPPGWGAEPPPPGGPRRRRLVWVGAGAAALVVLAVAIVFAVRSGQADIQTEDGEVTNAERFLDDVRDQWRTQLPTDNINVGDDPGCYYVVDDGSDEVTGVIACGGVRRLQSDDGEVWDVFSYDVRENANGDSVASSAQQVEESVERPDGKLLTASGDEASEEMKDLAAPELPEAESGLLRYGDEVGLDSIELTDVKRPEGKGKVITPGGTVTVQSVATAPYLMPSASSDSDEADTSDAAETGVAHQAADGEVFRVVTYTFEAAEDDESGGSTATTIMLDAGKQQTELGPSDDYGYDDEEAQQHVIASVPESGKAQLVVASAGHEQRVDLSTGKRQPDPITDAYYRDVVEQDIAKTSSYPTKKVYDGLGPEIVSYSLQIGSARLTPYVSNGGLGYAPKGKVWLLASFTEDLSVDGLWRDHTSQTWTVDAAGTTTDARAVFDESSFFDTEYVAAFKVPASVTSATFTTKKSVSVSTIGDGRKSTFTFGPTKATVKFPK